MLLLLIVSIGLAQIFKHGMSRSLADLVQERIESLLLGEESLHHRGWHLYVCGLLFVYLHL